MTQEELKEELISNGYEDTVVFENPNYSSAFVGVSEEGRAIYSYEDMVIYLMETDNMTEEEAAEFIDYNTVRSLPYVENSPIIMYKLV